MEQKKPCYVIILIVDFYTYVKDKPVGYQSRLTVIAMLSPNNDIFLKTIT